MDIRSVNNYRNDVINNCFSCCSNGPSLGFKRWFLTYCLGGTLCIVSTLVILKFLRELFPLREGRYTRDLHPGEFTTLKFMLLG